MMLKSHEVTRCDICNAPKMEGGIWYNITDKNKSICARCFFKIPSYIPDEQKVRYVLKLVKRREDEVQIKVVR